LGTLGREETDKYYSTIIQIRVADEGKVGEELVGWGVTLVGRNGHNQTITADTKIMENQGGTQQSSTALSLPAVCSVFSLFKLSYSQIYLNARATV
jgi:hypothetical protein